jgi:uncharacterized membrane protein (GlpM family)
VALVKKTAPAYRPGIDPPCPSVAVNGTIIVRDGTVSLEDLRAAVLSARE